MLRELRFLEAEFEEIDENEDRLEELGIGIRVLGRRLIDLCEEFVPKMVVEVAKEMDEPKIHQKKNEEPKVFVNNKKGVKAR